MNIVTMRIAVEQSTCNGCGAKDDPRIIQATSRGFDGRSGPPEGADLLAFQTELPVGWVNETRKGAEDSSRLLCAACAGTAKAAIETALPAIKNG